MKIRLSNVLMLSLAVMSMVSACRKKDAPQPDNLVGFQSTEQGIAATENTKTVNLTLTRAVNTDAPIVISLAPSAGVEYGTDFTTTPAAVAGQITLNVLSGNNEASFTVTKAPGALFYEDDNIVFTILSSGSSVIIGDQKEFKLTFSEIISTGSTIVGDGGGSTYGNKVFFDLSANSQTAVLRTKWDLGFYTGNDWRVTLNSSLPMMAKQLTGKTDLNAVTAADTIGFSSQVVFAQYPILGTLPYIDYPDGNLTKTAIDEISATATDNKVYIVNRGTGIGSSTSSRGWKKIRIIRNANGGYTLQHADIAATTFSSIDIPKETSHFFKYVSFEDGIVDVAPPARKWDIAWTYFINITSYMGEEVPYPYQDFILQNMNVEVAKVNTADKAYADFAEADLTGSLNLAWSSGQTSIGSGWRAGGGPSSAPVVTTTQYYIIKDGDGNYYKLRFTALTQDGERGHPAFDFALVKKAP